ncbi:MAG: hypothetical protein ACXADY_24785 [Candidatus Hodarchaeales archaeon]|jgi:hypothetical protein
MKFDVDIQLIGKIVRGILIIFGFLFMICDIVLDWNTYLLGLIFLLLAGSIGWLIKD